MNYIILIDGQQQISSIFNYINWSATFKPLILGWMLKKLFLSKYVYKTHSYICICCVVVCYVYVMGRTVLYWWWPLTLFFAPHSFLLALRTFSLSSLLNFQTMYTFFFFLSRCLFHFGFYFISVDLLSQPNKQTYCLAKSCNSLSIYLSMWT